MRAQVKQLKVLFIALVAGVAVLVGVMIMVGRPSGPTPEAVLTLTDYGVQDVLKIKISNQHSDYTVWQEENGFIIGDLPMEHVNPDYLLMLLEEASRIEYLSVVDETPKELSSYGLDNPEARAEISYTGGSEVTLLVGSQESISGDRYCMVEGQGRVLLLKNGRTIRFTMPITSYINFTVVPFGQTGSPLYAVGDITFSGTKLPEPIVVEVVEEGDTETLRDAASFGAATHIIRSPGLHEVDKTAGMEIFGSVAGLLNKQVLDYNCTDKELSEYGFDEPYLTINFDFIETKGGEKLPVVLKVVPYGEDYLLVRDDQRIVHIIDHRPFIAVDYNRLVLRWFLTPFITDIAKVQLQLEGGGYEFKLAGDTNSSLSVSQGENQLDIDAFRSYYSLLISAQNDGSGLVKPPESLGEPLMKAMYYYKDKEKPPDSLALYTGSDRKLYVEVNGIIEFTMQERYLSVLKEATNSLLQGESFETEW